MGREERIDSGICMGILVDLNANASIFLIKISQKHVHTFD